LNLKALRIVEGRGLTYRADDVIVVDASVSAGIPKDYFLSVNYPNPFNNATRLLFGLPEGGRAVVKVFDLGGRELATLADGQYSSGTHAVVWQAEHAPTGIYLANLKANGCQRTRKVALVK